MQARQDDHCDHREQDQPPKCASGPLGHSATLYGPERSSELTAVALGTQPENEPYDSSHSNQSRHALTI